MIEAGSGFQRLETVLRCLLPLASLRAEVEGFALLSLRNLCELFFLWAAFASPNLVTKKMNSVDNGLNLRPSSRIKTQNTVCIHSKNM